MSRKSISTVQCPGGPSGFSLIEVLVALLVLSIGLLGLAGLQARGLKDNHGSLLRSHGVQRAEDVLDRMRANRALALEGHYEIALGVIPGSPLYEGVPMLDLIEWKNALSRSLPLGDGSVALSGNIVTVIVQWSEAAGEQSISVVTRL